MARESDKYKGKKIVLRGEIIQVFEDGNDVTLRVNLNGNYDHTICVTYIRKSGEGRVLEDDIINIYGTYKGLYTYESVLGADVTVPYVDAKYIELAS